MLGKRPLGELLRIGTTLLLEFGGLFGQRLLADRLHCRMQRFGKCVGCRPPIDQRARRAV
ncbi:hypothetical protein LX81_04265 [Palleronia aestuarii]|uniref:Uncharacterized protein n=1 Tax=Palleronia aestuarii TaxID=568105 RepID=A0A2W7NGA6_9RHOB|nr:hypothetical protein LX81_04265 [Palleronia aestuarii]